MSCENQKPLKPDALLFDWDNTLVDAWGLIHKMLMETFVSVGKDPWSLDDTKRHTTRSMRESFADLFGDKCNDASLIYTNLAERHSNDMTLLDGVTDMLRFVSGANIKVAIVSNKRGFLLRQEVTNMGLGGFFNVMVGSGDAERDKPSALPALMAMKGLNVNTDSHNIWFIGDTIIDIECACNANCLPVLYGSSSVSEEILENSETKPALRVASHGALVKLLHDII